jgi:hypothetical protein
LVSNVFKLEYVIGFFISHIACCPNVPISLPSRSHNLHVRSVEAVKIRSKEYKLFAESTYSQDTIAESCDLNAFKRFGALLTDLF